MRALLVVVILLMCAGVSACSSTSCGPGAVEIDGECKPLPSATDCGEPCGEHEYCDEDVEPATCQCVAGYEGEQCMWAGAPLDPEFANDEVWLEINGATVLPFEVGLGQGVASLAPDVVCNGGRVSQVFDMPSYASAEPFVAEVTYRAEFVNGVGVGFGRAFKTLPVLSDWTTARFCLGEAAYGPAAPGYGGPVEFQVGASERSTLCNAEPFRGIIEFDRLEIKVADPQECPEPGSVLNGEAVTGAGGWVFEVEDEPGDGLAEGSLSEAVGKDDTSGARVFKAAGENRASMATQLSVELPTSGPSPALKFWWKASEGSVFRAEIGTHYGPRNSNRILGVLVGSGSATTSTYCLPPWTHGNVVELAFLPFVESFDEETELVVDAVELFEDPRCGEATELFDPGFDSAPNRWPGTHDFGSQTQGNSILLRDDADRARTGRGVLEITYSANDQKLRFEHWVLVPEPVGERGPLLVFYSKFPADAPVTVYSFLGRSGDRTSRLIGGDRWEINEVCLYPEWSGRWFRFQVRIDPSMEGFALIEPPVQILLDDFELTTSELCRAE